MHPQTLRQYDRLGLVVPARTQGGSRRYSLRHVEQLREVARLSIDGMSLPAIARIIELEERVRELHFRVHDLEARVRTELENRPGARVFAAGATGSVVTLRQGTRVRRATDRSCCGGPAAIELVARRGLRLRRGAPHPR